MADPKVKAILSRGDEDRAAKLGAYFRDFLSGWLQQIILGTALSGYSERVKNELVMALLEHAAVALIAASDSAKDEPDEDTAERAKRAAREVFAVLQREILS